LKFNCRPPQKKKKRKKRNKPKQDIHCAAIKHNESELANNIAGDKHKVDFCYDKLSIAPTFGIGQF